MNDTPVLELLKLGHSLRCVRAHILSTVPFFVVTTCSSDFKCPSALSKCGPGVRIDLKQLLPAIFKSKKVVVV